MEREAIHLVVEPTVIHAYGADITAADVRAALAGVPLGQEGHEGDFSEGLTGLLERLAVSVNDGCPPKIRDDARLAWVSVSETQR